MSNLNDYAKRFSNVEFKREDGILQVTLHTGGDSLIFNGKTHEEFTEAFRMIGEDKENRVVILTGAGKSFCAEISPEGFDFFTPNGYDKIFNEGRRVLDGLLNIEAPVIAAVNGPALLHTEYILLSDVVLASDTAEFQDLPHFNFGIVPGDGVHVVWPEVIGSVRGRYFLLTQQKLSAKQALEYGAVNEVLPGAKLLPRAWEIARGLIKQNPLTLRYTRLVLTQRMKRLIHEGLPYGLALEGISAAAVAEASRAAKK
jgi:enoyl-CoA hydratase/carnithine racemase